MSGGQGHVLQLRRARGGATHAYCNRGARIAGIGRELRRFILAIDDDRMPFHTQDPLVESTEVQGL
jgi:hypothetical protein